MTSRPLSKKMDSDTRNTLSQLLMVISSRFSEFLAWPQRPQPMERKQYSSSMVSLTQQTAGSPTLLTLLQLSKLLELVMTCGLATLEETNTLILMLILKSLIMTSGVSLSQRWAEVTCLLPSIMLEKSLDNLRLPILGILKALHKCTMHWPLMRNSSLTRLASLLHLGL